MRLSRHVSNAAVRSHFIFCSVESKNLGASSTWLDQTQKQPNSRGFACTIRPQITQHLAFLYFQRQRIQRRGITIALGQPLCPNRNIHVSPEKITLDISSQKTAVTTITWALLDEFVHSSHRSIYSCQTPQFAKRL